MILKLIVFNHHQKQRMRTHFLNNLSLPASLQRSGTKIVQNSRESLSKCFLIQKELCTTVRENDWNIKFSPTQKDQMNEAVLLTVSCVTFVELRNKP